MTKPYYGSHPGYDAPGDTPIVRCTCHDDGEVLDMRGCLIHDDEDD